MSVTAMSRTFWTDFPPLAYTDKKGKQITIKDTTAKIVLLAIADNADDFGENSYQSFETLATKASVDRRSVMRVVRALVANGFLEVAGISAYGTNNYTVCLDKLGHPPKKRAKTGRPKSGDSEALLTRTGDGGAVTSDPEVKTGDSVTESDDHESPESSFNPPLSIHETKEELEEQKDSLIETITSVALSIFPDIAAWWNVRGILNRPSVQITGDVGKRPSLDDPARIVISGLSEKPKGGQFTLAEIWEQRFTKSFANQGIQIEFRS
jgi:hypothetical protein